MISKKSIFRLQRRLLRNEVMLQRMDPDKAGLSISDYNALCSLSGLQQGRHTITTKSGRSLVLK